MKLKKNYFEDISLFRNRASLIWTIALLAILFSLPFIIKSYYLSILNLMVLNVIVALGLNILVGNTGQISLGHAGFVAIGAYLCAFCLQGGIPFFITLLIAGIITGIVGALLGLPSLKLEGPYLAIATLGFGIAVMVIIGRLDIFGGRMGMAVPRINLKWTGLGYDRSLYFVFIVSVVILTILTQSLIQSKIGRAFQAIRDSDIAAAVSGIHVSRYKTLSFAISAFYAGIAGSLWSLYLQFVTPGTFTFMMSVLFLATVVLGGLGSVTGSIMGGIVMTYLSLQADAITDLPLLGSLIETFSMKYMTHSAISNIKWVLTGLTLIALILFEPLGLFGVWLRVKRYWRLWPF